MDSKSEMEENISSSSSSSSDDCPNPNHTETPQRQLQLNSSNSYNRKKNTQMQMAQKTKRVRDERLSLSLLRSKCSKGKNDQRLIKRTLLSWLIDVKVIQQNEKVCHVNKAREEASKQGMIRRDGILCDCCHEIFTALDFEVHAGSGDLKRPYENIFFNEEPQISLLSCLIEAWDRTKQIEQDKLKDVGAKYRASDKHDDACMICVDGGSLLCCDMCSSTYHQDCIDMDVVPEGAWLCPYCVCKFCGNPCGANDCLVTCFQCEKRYHWECYQERNLESIDVNSPSTPLCEQSCKEVYEKLEKMVGLAVARIVMEECFEPIKDRNTKIIVIRNVVYNWKSNYTWTNFRGFHSAILEKDDEIISVASVRALCYLKVESMVIPSIREKIGTWTERYGFQHIGPFLSKEIRHRNILTFHDSYRLQKILAVPQAREVREVENNEPQNGPNLLGIAAREVHEVENNEHRNGSVFENKLPMQAIFDLNMELAEKDGVNEDSDITSNNTH
ncbi:unnamed protein product [Camellia sinensis]